MSTNLVNKDTGELVTLANGTRMWIGTKTAHDLAVQQGTMPNNCMVCITDDAAGEEAWEYSTSETRTGKTWIDGKPIYRRVVELVAPSSGSYASTTTFTNTDIVAIYGTYTRANEAAVYPATFPTITNLSDAVTVMVNTNRKIEIRKGSNWTGVSTTHRIVVEYTKSTD